jgi:Ca2+-binding EF-hand superfamily protein
MGASNRDLESLGQTAKNVFESSYMKSQSQYHKTSHSLPPPS